MWQKVEQAHSNGLAKLAFKASENNIEASES